MSIRLFEDIAHANLYAKYRPSPPKKVYDVVLDFLQKEIPSQEWNTAVDVGCGSGQNTNGLASYFTNVYGFDVSPAQIETAKQLKHPPNVHFHVIKY